MFSAMIWLPPYLLKLSLHLSKRSFQGYYSDLSQSNKNVNYFVQIKRFVIENCIYFAVVSKEITLYTQDRILYLRR